MALKDNILTPEVKRTASAASRKTRLAKSIDQIALTYQFEHAKPKAADVFDPLVPAAGRGAQGRMYARGRIGGFVTAFVALDDVSHVYGGAGSTLAVDGLSIHVERGEFIAIVGPSGCGKSTLMKLATGLQLPVQGHACRSRAQRSTGR